ncbi:SAM-dependent methyltransferase [Nocardia sp. NPDC052566]|uniref:SAM-dependent methyltransferase n=1 Tax=Nocardia sp. NPDC052566 TaxID=3364330 RepID=UPI0037C84FBB
MNEQSEHSAEPAASGRIHDYLLGGKDHYMVDRETGKRLVEDVSEFAMVARAARRFLVRAVHCLVAEHRVRQIVELGSGYPCEPNLHQVAQAANPAARTLYIDNDPVVAAHGHALLAKAARTHFNRADLTDTATIIDSIRDIMIPDEPIAICLGFVCEFIDDPWAVLDALTKSLPAGSYVVLSHVTDDVTARVAEIYGDRGIMFRPRTCSEIAGLLAGCDLLEPGLVAPHRWRPEGELNRIRSQQHGWEPPQAAEVSCRAAVGRLR